MQQGPSIDDAVVAMEVEYTSIDSLGRRMYRCVLHGTDSEMDTNERSWALPENNVEKVVREAVEKTTG